MKKCSKCGQSKPLSEFGNNKAQRDGKQAYCKPCAVEANRKYRKQNPEKVAEKNRKWQQKNPGKVAEYAREYRKKNLEKVAESQRKWREQNPEKISEKSRKWREQNPEKAAEKYHRRRARKQANGVFLILDKELARLYASPCVGCGSTENIQADHIIPIAKKGQHSVGNLQPLCGSCNASKQDKLPVEWQRTKLMEAS